MNNDIKIHILFDFVDGAWGGGNQFLKAIKNYLIDQGVYTNNYQNANIILINSYNNYDKALKIKLKNTKVKFVHRIDGPITYYRDDGYFLDKIIFKLNNILVDGTIFQSNYTKNASIDKSINLDNQLDKVIINAPNPEIFYKKKYSKLSNKIKLIATSWSGNIKKGFDVYEWLDNNLDFSKYEMTFVGNSPIVFKNIKHKESMNSNELSEELRKSDIFIFASKIESCSNSLLEALHCGLPAIAYNSTSMPEIVKDGGELFDSKNEIVNLLDKIVNNYDKYTGNISVPSIEDIGKEYLNFIVSIYENKDFKNINTITYLYNIFTLKSIFIIKQVYIKIKSFFNAF